MTLHLRRFLPWFNLPLGVLLALLQRTPAVRAIVSAGEPTFILRAGEILRAAVGLSSLGAVHSLAGATAWVQSPAGTVRGTVGTAVDVVFTYTGTPSPPAVFQVSGTLPPGLSYVPAPIGGNIRSETPRITGIPTQAGNFSISVQGFNATGLTNGVRQTIAFAITGGTANVAPTIAAQPQSQTVNAGGSVTLTVEASGTPAPTYQWSRNGSALPGATAATLTLTNVQPANAGTYTVTVTNSAGTITSRAASLTVNPAGTGTAPAISAHPLAVTVSPGATAALTVVASGTPAPLYQWRRDGTPLAGATDATLLLSGVTAASAGAYSVVVNNPAGTVTSNAASLTVSAGTGRLANLSVRTSLGLDSTLIVGFATNGSKSTLIRGIGPTLGAFGVPGVYGDPRLELYDSSQIVISRNEDWNAALAPAFAAVGAFPLTNASKDAALQATVSGAHSAHLKGPGSGVVLVELYDSGSGTTVRLVNVSARNQVGTGDNILIAGFVVDGTVAKTLLIRAVGPTLAAFGVGGTLVDPKLEIYDSASVKLVENDNWSPSLASTAAAVGAFALVPDSRDAALLVTLPPGSYSAQISGIANGTGEALVEVYEVP
jgi:hypothetical protein